MASYLVKAGFRVTTAKDAHEAVDLAKQEHFDLVITDYYMPGATGTDLAAELRKVDRYCGTPIILLTARADELNAANLGKDLSLLVVSKPYSVTRLVNIVSNCLAIRSPC